MLTPRMKLGKLKPKHHPATLDFGKILLPDAPPPPPEKAFWEYKTDPYAIGMYGNDVCGDCTLAAIAHYLLLVTAHTGKPFYADPAEVLKAYSAISGYDPKTGANDNGCAITDVLNYMRVTGIQGYKIEGWAQIDHTSLLHLHQGIYIFGGNNIGVQLPAIAQDQFSDNQSWEVVPDDGGIEGGHCILESGYGSEGSNFESWGKGDQKASNEWSSKYKDEGYVVFTKDWINEASGLAPNSFDLDALVNALKAVAAL
jgi:hypothetical protein